MSERAIRGSPALPGPHDLQHGDEARLLERRKDHAHPSCGRSGCEAWTSRGATNAPLHTGAAFPGIMGPAPRFTGLTVGPAARSSPLFSLNCPSPETPRSWLWRVRPSGSSSISPIALMDDPARPTTRAAHLPRSCIRLRRRVKALFRGGESEPGAKPGAKISAPARAHITSTNATTERRGNGASETRRPQLPEMSSIEPSE